MKWIVKSFVTKNKCYETEMFQKLLHNLSVKIPWKNSAFLMNSRIIIFLLFAISLSMIDAKKFRLFGRRHHHHHHHSNKPAKAEAEPTKTTTSEQQEATTTSTPAADPTTSSVLTSTPTPTADYTTTTESTTTQYNFTSVEPTKTRNYQQASNLRLVYQTVLPMGLARSSRNVVFEYDDEEAGKKCRCICRMNNSLS